MGVKVRYLVGKVQKVLKTQAQCVIMVIAKGAMGRTLPTAALFADVSVHKGLSGNMRKGILA
jgi:hypothetical protein